MSGHQDKSSETQSNPALYASLHASVVRTPPPPGFKASDTNNFLPREHHLNDSSRLNSTSNAMQQRTLITPNRHVINGLSGDNNHGGGASRSQNYLTLATALGEEFVESMGDSLFDQERRKVPGSSLSNDDVITRSDGNNNTSTSLFSKAPTAPGSNFTITDSMGMDNFTRQSRHNLSRAIGSSHSSQPFQSQINNSNNKISSLQNDLGNIDNHTLQNINYTTHSLLDSINYENYRQKFMYDPSSITVEEPLSTSVSPAPQKIQLGLLNKNKSSKMNGFTSSDVDNLLTEATQKLRLYDNMSSFNHAGRASAPPVFDYPRGDFTAANAVLRHQTASSLQQRASELINLKLNEDDNDPQTTLNHSHNSIPSYPNEHNRLTPQLSLPVPQNVSPAPKIFMQEAASDSELFPFLWSEYNASIQGNGIGTPNPPSRALAIMGANWLNLKEARSTCEAFGSLLYFRQEFCVSRGVILLAYHDLRSARHANKELLSYLQRLEPADGSSDTLKVMYCVSLNSSSPNDDSLLLISNVPSNLDDKDVSDLVTCYGAVRSVRSHPNSPNMNDRSVRHSYTVEFYDIHDASQAHLEIQSTMPWGPEVTISHQERSMHERKRGQELLSLIAKWRHGEKHNNMNVALNISRSNTPSMPIVSQQINPNKSPIQACGQNSPHSSMSDSNEGRRSEETVYSGAQQNLVYNALTPTTQLVVGPNGQYSYVMVSPPSYSPYIPQGGLISPMQSMVPAVHTSYDGRHYWVQPHSHMQPQGIPSYQPIPNQSMISGQQYTDVRNGLQVANTYTTVPGAYSSTPVSSNHHNSTHLDSSLSVSSGTSGSRKDPPDRVAPESSIHLALNIETVRQGADTRTSLMVRNIPNKYTQSMLLSEFQDCGYGPGKIDFFYLPIDFRNKCNRGYAFINFVDYRDIISFYQLYNGQNWKIFKSDKICEITYARIQGKSSMLKRFQNSALMEKDPEYRPLIFSSNGVKEEGSSS